MIVQIHGGQAQIDESDLPKLGHRKWHVLAVKNSQYRYASRMCRLPDGRWHRELMHRIIMDAPKGIDVDHINGDGLDNRRCNLRLCTRSQNLGNSSTRCRFKGIYKYPHGWVAKIGAKCIGVFPTPIEAAKAYDQEAIAKWGDFARTNAMMGKL